MMVTRIMTGLRHAKREDQGRDQGQPVRGNPFPSRGILNIPKQIMGQRQPREVTDYMILLLLDFYRRKNIRQADRDGTLPTLWGGFHNHRVGLAKTYARISGFWGTVNAMLLHTLAKGAGREAPGPLRPRLCPRSSSGSPRGSGRCSRLPSRQASGVGGCPNPIPRVTQAYPSGEVGCLGC